MDLVPTLNSCNVIKSLINQCQVVALKWWFAIPSEVCRKEQAVRIRVTERFCGVTGVWRGVKYIITAVLTQVLA